MKRNSQLIKFTEQKADPEYAIDFRLSDIQEADIANINLI